MRAKRIDNTARALTAYAESLGFVVYTINGDIDAAVVFGDVVTLVDWKSTGGELTANQSRLLARGVPIKFISKPEQLDALKAYLLRSEW